MKKNLFTISTVVFSTVIYSQVGINNQNPRATLDVTAKNTDGTTPEGFIAPRLTGDQIKSADSQYGISQKGIIVYATSAVTTTSAKTVNITGEGYYYFDGNLWQKMVNSATTAEWGLNGNTGTTASTSAIDSNANNNFIGTTDAQDFVLAANSKEAIRINNSNQRVGVSTTTPQATLDVTGTPTDTSKLDGIIPPRITGVQLRAKTYTTSQTGAIVYATAADTAPAGQTINVTVAGFYYFDGSVWVQLMGRSTTTGSSIYKAPLQSIVANEGYTQVFNVGDFEFKMVPITNGQKAQIRFTGTGTRTYTSITHLDWQPGQVPGYSTLGGQSGTATNTFTDIAGNTYGNNTTYMVGVIRIYDSVTNKYYRYEISRFVDSTVTTVFYYQTCEVY
ncbi:hypothetical protein [Chryseobacterium populi]|nr:hypothetical protein [Chryseobacterium populi]